MSLLSSLLLRRYPELAHIPGPTSRFPLGTVHELAHGLPWRTSLDYAERYGPYTLLWVFDQPAVFVHERRVGDRALAEDILQDAYAKSATHLAEVRTPAAASAWFFSGLRNASHESHRRGARRDRALSAVEAELALAARELGPDERDVDCRRVGELVDALKPEYAEALARIEVDGVPVKQFADEHGISANNAAVRVHRARKALAREVVNTCGACASLGCVDCSCEH